MCIIQGEIESVAKTNILVSNTMFKNKQLTVYANQINLSNDPVAMILPFPNHTKQNFIKVLPTTNDDLEMFEYLSNVFKIQLKSFSQSLEYFDYDSLEVLRCGSYRYSIVSNISDFDNINKNVFKLSSKVKEILMKNYKNDFGFIVCIIDKSADYSPFAYITDKMPDNKFFIPTLHYHTHNEISPSLNFNIEIDEGYTNDWDHNIYIFGTNDKMVNYLGDVKNPVKDINKSKIIFPKLLRNIYPCKQLKINGYNKNIDIIVN